MGDSNLNTKTTLIKAYQELKRVQQQLAAARTRANEPIAIIGMDCRFPKAPNPDAFWNLLKTGTSAVSEIPANRWDWKDNYVENTDDPNKTNSKWGAFVDDIEYFDPLFFDISPREAITIDPQQRLFLEVAWRAFENAGYSKEKLDGSCTGVFVGSTNNDYYRYIEPYLTSADYKAGLGNENGVIPNRVSYFFNLKGPSLMVNTLCSSSLVAIDMACQSIRQRDCRMALVGGVNMQISSDYYVNMSKMNILSGDGKCHTFCEEANGIVLGEGAGAILLKTLSKAMKDGDRILGVIKGTATNHGGTANGLTAPNPSAQANLIEEALKSANLSAEDINYVEAHGTGTSLGDPIEIEGLTKAYQKYTSKKQYCSIGSVKTNIGHLESAAGIAQVIKVLLCMQHEQLPPHLNYNEPNASINFENTPFKINTELQPWKADGLRRAGISSFGLGGTNAHIILEEAVETSKPSEASKSQKPYEVFSVSAKNAKALRTRVDQFSTFLNKNKEVHIHDLCRNVNLNQSHFKKREAWVFSSLEDLKRQMADYSEPTVKKNLSETQTAFLFTGQGSQYVGMGKELYENEDQFREIIDQCAALLTKDWDCSLTEVLFEKEDLLHQTRYTQPALFALEYALAKCWLSWGITPDYLLGHSIGEYALACIAGVFSLEDGMRLAVARGKLMQDLPDTGTMVTVYAPIKDVRAYLDIDLNIAAYNGPENIVLSGSKERIEEVIEDLASKNSRTRLLNVSHAFHSSLMQPMIKEFTTVAQQVRYHIPSYPIVSTVTGNFVKHEMSTPDYWVRHILSPVKFQQGIEQLLRAGLEVNLEIGPNPTLIALTRSITNPDRDILWLPSLRKKNPDTYQMLSTLTELYKINKSINWPAIYADQPHFDRLNLPQYPFQRDKYWMGEPATSEKKTKKQKAIHPLLGHTFATDKEEEFTWRSEINPDQLRFLSDHQVNGEIVFPLSAYIEMAVQATRSVEPDKSYEINSMEVTKSLCVSDQDDTLLQSTMSVGVDGSLQFRVFSQSPTDQEEWSLHAEAEIVLA